MADRMLGAAGILGGVVLLAAFVIDIPGSVNVLRLVLFNLGAIAVVVALYRRQAAVEYGCSAWSPRRWSSRIPGTW